MGFTSSGLWVVGNADGSIANGQVWKDAHIIVGNGFAEAGTGSFIQLISASRQGIRETSNYPTAYVNWDYYPPPGGSSFYGLQSLDSGVPYPFGAVWALPADGSGVDSPMQPVILESKDNGGTLWNSSTANDTMTTWMMYRPPAVGSMKTVLIPMANYAWGWSASASRTTSPLTPWMLTPGPPPHPGPPMLTTDHPSWIRFLPSPFPFGPAL